jgi:HAD superfamily hydrolase (TIGR01509 family)
MHDRSGYAVGGLPAAVLFDVGMTLIYPSGDVMVRVLDDIVPGHSVNADQAARALAIAAEAHHYNIGPSTEPTDIVGLMWGNLLDLPDGCGAAAWKACTQTRELYSVLDPDAACILAALRHRGVKTAAVSNATNSLRDELAEFDLIQLLDVAIGSNEGYREKPHPDLFLAATTALGVDPQQCWHVGDGLINDILGASRAHIDVQILIDRYDVHRRPPCLRVRSMRDLRELVSAL